MESTTRRSFIGKMAATAAVSVVGGNVLGSALGSGGIEDIRMDAVYCMAWVGGPWRCTWMPGYEWGRYMVSVMQREGGIKTFVQKIDGKVKEFRMGEGYFEAGREIDLTEDWLERFFELHKDDTAEDWQKRREEGLRVIYGKAVREETHDRK